MYINLIACVWPVFSLLLAVSVAGVAHTEYRYSELGAGGLD